MEQQQFIDEESNYQRYEEEYEDVMQRGGKNKVAYSQRIQNADSTAEDLRVDSVDASNFVTAYPVVFPDQAVNSQNRSHVWHRYGAPQEWENFSAKFIEHLRNKE